MRYGVIVEPAGHGYSGYVPDLPGCVAAARSVEQVRALLEEATRLHVDALTESGEPVPKPTSVCEYVDASDGAAPASTPGSRPPR